MKKFLLSLAAVAIAGSAFAAEATQLFELKFGSENNAGNTHYPNNSSYSGSFTYKLSTTGSESFTIINFNNNNNKWSNMIKCGSSKTPSVGSITSDFKITQQLTSVVLGIEKLNESGVINSFKLQTSTDNTTWTDVVTASESDYDSTNGTLTLATDAAVVISDVYVRVAIDCATTKANGVVWLNYVQYYGIGTADNRLDADIKFPQGEYTAILDEDFVSPVATKATTAELVYSSSDTEVATVDPATGVVTLNVAGTTIITAAAEGNDEYKPGEAFYVLTVKPAGLIYSSVLGEDFTFENVEGENYPWSHDSQYGLKGSGFVNKSTIACEGYAVSPVINLNGYKSATLNFQQALNQYKENNVMIDVADFSGYAYIMAREEGATEWTMVQEASAPEKGFSWSFFANAPVTLDAYAGKKMQFAFKYVSTEAVAGTWEVKDIEVIGEKGTVGVNAVEIDANAPVEYYNMQGVRVQNPEKGLFIVRQGGKVSKVIL